MNTIILLIRILIYIRVILKGFGLICWALTFLWFIFTFSKFNEYFFWEIGSPRWAHHEFFLIFSFQYIHLMSKQGSFNCLFIYEFIHPFLKLWHLFIIGINYPWKSKSQLKCYYFRDEMKFSSSLSSQFVFSSFWSRILYNGNSRNSTY